MTIRKVNVFVWAGYPNPQGALKWGLWVCTANMVPFWEIFTKQKLQNIPDLGGQVKQRVWTLQWVSMLQLVCMLQRAVATGLDFPAGLKNIRVKLGTSAGHLWAKH